MAVNQKILVKIEIFGEAPTPEAATARSERQAGSASKFALQLFA
jgi:hypothetical protein